MLTVSTSLVIAWDRCGASASCGGIIGSNKDDGARPLASGDVHERVFHGIQILFHDIDMDGILHFDLILFATIFGHLLEPLIAIP